MATQPQYTDRQLEIIKLLDKNKTPKEIARALKITENAVYQQLGRIRKARGETKPKRTTASKTKQAPKRTPRKRAAPAKPAAEPAPELAAVTPLQAVRVRERAIKAQLAESGQRVESARKVFEREDEAHGKLVANREEELRQLAVAEAALLGKLPKAVKARASRPKATAPSGNGAQAAQEPAQESQAATPEPEPVAVTAEPQPPVAVAQERPGVPTVEEFAQEDAFPEGEPAA